MREDAVDKVRVDQVGLNRNVGVNFSVSLTTRVYIVIPVIQALSNKPFSISLALFLFLQIIIILI